MASLTHLIVNTDGFAFCPASGDAFLVNPSARVILEVLQVSGGQEEAVRRLTDIYAVSPEQAQHDVADFQDRLRSLGLLQNRDSTSRSA